MSAGWPTRYQPVWIAYAAAHGRTPDDQVSYETRNGTTSFAGFIGWVSAQQRKWEAETGETLTPSTRERFHAWLEAS